VDYVKAVPEMIVEPVPIARTNQNLEGQGSGSSVAS